jgi:hypothetical protein
MLIELLIIIFLIYALLNIYLNRTTFEKYLLNIANKNSETIFSIDNITYFSSCNAEASVASNSNFLIENLYQYTDIAIFINNNSENGLTLKNTLKELYIDNIEFSKKPEAGTPLLYYKNIKSFATATFDEENLITDTINFNISSEDEEDLSTPTLYNNCANPITISYVNNNIKSDYTLSDIITTYDGSLLKKCSVPLSTISCSISFTVHIINNLDQEYICPIYMEIPLSQSSGTSIYDGKIVLKDSTNYTFFRTK